MKSLNLNKSDFSENLIKSVVYGIDEGFESNGTNTITQNLKIVEHPEYTNGMVWGGMYKNWSWKNPPEVRVNGDIVTTGYTVNYRDGLIIFSSVKTNVSAMFTYKKVFILDAKELPFFRGESGKIEVYEGSFRPEAIQLPFVGVELGGGTSKPFELGNYNRDVKQTILLNVVSNDKTDCSKLSQMLFEQVDGNIYLFDHAQASRSGLIPLNDDGELVNSSGTYNNLCAFYPYRDSIQFRADIQDTEKESINKLSNDLYHCTVRWEVSSTLKMSV